MNESAESSLATVLGDWAIPLEQTVERVDDLTTISGTIVLPVYRKPTLPSAVRALNTATGGQLESQLLRSGFKGERQESRLLMDLPGIAADRVLIIGCGHRSTIDARRYRGIAMHTAKTILSIGTGPVSCAIALISVKRRDRLWRLRQLASIIANQCCKSNSAIKNKDSAPTEILTHLVKKSTPRLQAARAVNEAIATTQGQTLARRLGNCPPNYCTPTFISQVALELGKRFDTIDTEVLQAKEIQAEGMGGIVSVARGSSEPATMSQLHYRHADAKGPPVVLIGKGVSFDSGGLSIKTAASMQYMKMDMAGAAAILGTLASIAELDLPVHVIGLIPAVENMPGPTATRPGDVVKMLSGMRVEVLNTDAEGRLILADALQYAKKFKPEVVIDIATLTGSAKSSLGRHMSALFTNSSRLEKTLIQAGNSSHDRVWPMPLLEDYSYVLNSKVADIANVGGSTAGAIVAACFLEKFVKGMKWAHIDIAGTAGQDGECTGRPVPLLVDWINRRASVLK